MLLPVFDDDGHPVKAHFTLDSSGSIVHIIIESRGGTIGSANERNPGYAVGFELLIVRAARLKLILSDAVVVSSKLIREGLSPSDRRLHADGVFYPLTLSESNAADVAARLQRSQTVVGSTPGQRGGNRTRRVLLVFEHGPEPLKIGDLASYFSGTALCVLPEDVLSEASRTLEIQGVFDPGGLIDARRQIVHAIAVRQGQPQFRKHLLAAYSGRCAVSGCDVEAVLEAAHIVPYQGSETNHIQNGLLLRADLHTLFDRGLMSVDPRSLRVVLHHELRNGPYGCYHDTPLAPPAQMADRPSPLALNAHFSAAGL